LEGKSGKIREIYYNTLIFNWENPFTHVEWFYVMKNNNAKTFLGEKVFLILG